MKKASKIYIWQKMLRKFKNVSLRFINSLNNSERKRLERKLDLIEKRLYKFHHKQNLTVCLVALGLFLSSNIAVGQDTINISSSARVDSISTDVFRRVGDLNDDGNEDFGIKTKIGFHVVFGDGNEFDENIDLGSLSSGDGMYLHSTNAYEFANTVEVLNDINGDGINDLALFDYYRSYSQDHPSYVFFGKKGTLPDSLDMHKISNGDGLELTSSGNYWTEDLEAGDVNGDGVTDIILGNWNYERAEVFLGKKEGFASKSVNWDSSLNGTDGFTIKDDAGISGFSVKRVSVPGDINGDGYDDIVFSTGLDWLTPTSQDDSCEVFTLFGKAQFTAEIKTSEIDGTNGFSIIFNTGNISPLKAGDLNGDGIDDVAFSPIKPYMTNIIDATGYIIYGNCQDSFPHKENIKDFIKLRKHTVLPNFISNSGDISIDQNGDGFEDFAFNNGNGNTIVSNPEGITASCGMANLDELSISEFNLYPNPATNFINISSEANTIIGSTVSIFTELGQNVYEAKIQNYSTQIDLRKFKKGFYILIVYNENTQMTTAKKLMVN